ncbi:MAG: GNAT family N-acetyltransferase [Oscillospiraceae bacterium]|nr:GNAT family N-acetyltransferase [Oscillospiraceae bacterium]
MTVRRASELAFDPREQMGRIFAHGFYDHGLHGLSKDKAVLSKAFEHIFDLDKFYVTVEDDVIMGFVGCSDKNPSPIKPDKKVFVEHFGFLRGNIGFKIVNKYMVNNKYPFALTPQTGSIDFVATAPEYMGKGVMTSLLSHVMNDSPFSEYALEVIDINAPAIRLYEKLGFREVKRVPAPKGSGLKYLVYMRRISN